MKEDFKERVRLEIIKAAKKYQEVYVDYEYLICSEAFKQNHYYIIDAQKDNFQHLTGVHSQISAQIFLINAFKKHCPRQTLIFPKKVKIRNQ